MPERADCVQEHDGDTDDYDNDSDQFCFDDDPGDADDGAMITMPFKMTTSVTIRILMISSMKMVRM